MSTKTINASALAGAIALAVSSAAFMVGPAQAAQEKGVPVLSFTARDGGALAPLSDVAVIGPTSRTDRAQEIHLCIEHLICDAVESTLAR